MHAGPAAREGNYGEARSHLEESVQATREIGLEAYEAGALKKLAWVAELQNSHSIEKP